MTINFICRKSKARKNGLSPIELSIIINKERKIITLDRKISYTSFNPKTQSIKGKSNEAKEINDYLQTIKLNAYTTQNKLLQNNIPITLDNFINAFVNNNNNNTNQNITITDTYKKYIIQHYTHLYNNNQITKTTLDKYQITLQYIIKYMQQQTNNNNNISNITTQWIENFYIFLLNYMNNNSANKIMTKLKKYINILIQEKIIINNPYKFKQKETISNKQPLTQKQINLLKEINLNDDKLNLIKDIFIVQLYCGLSFTDFKTLNLQKFQNEQIIHINRQKTKILSTIIILPTITDILKKYDYHLQIPNIQYYNKKLKIISEKIRQKNDPFFPKLSSHIARHSFGTMLINNNVSLPIIAKCMGHSNTKITENIYAKLNDDTIYNEIMKIKDNI